MRHLLIGLLVLTGCRPEAPADTVAHLRIGLEVGVGACRVYSLSPQLPKDKKLDAYCPGILATKEAP